MLQRIISHGDGVGKEGGSPGEGGIQLVRIEKDFGLTGWPRLFRRGGPKTAYGLHA
jgi:hypothetical protein